jgi:GDPmannose 4,6-dehydratase
MRTLIHPGPISGGHVKITRGLARINEGLEDCLYMGKLDALRDWGHARDYVEMQWRMLK